MSMNCSLLGLTPVQIDGLVATPAIVPYLTLWDSIDEFIKRLPPERQRHAEEARERIAQLGPFESPLRLQKWWHTLHYFLTGEIWPAGGDGDFLFTGQNLGETVIYEPARLHSPTETEDFSRFLQAQDLANLQARIDLQETKRIGAPRRSAIYPREIDDRDIPTIRRLFVDLRDYIHEMSDKGNGVLIWVV